MKSSKSICLLFIVSVLILAACTPSVRYTYKEIQEYPLDVQERIMKGEVSLGMNQQQVRYTWGPPKSIKLLEPVDGKQREEWVYSTLGVYDMRLLIFMDNKLIYISGEGSATK